MKTYLFLILGLIPICIQAQITGEIHIEENELHFVKERNFDKITGEFAYTNEVGKPELPVIYKSYVVPSNATHFNLQTYITTKKQLKGSYLIYPVQPQQVDKKEINRSWTVPNPLIYNSVYSFPNKEATIISDRYIQGYHIITFICYPVEYVPMNRCLYIRDITFTLSYESGENNLLNETKISNQRAQLSQAFVKTLVENPESVDLYTNSFNIIPESTNLNSGLSNSMARNIPYAVEERVPDFIIITSKILENTFQRLAYWKTKKGIPTVIQTVEKIEQDYQGADLVEKIRNYIQDAQKRWNGNSLFILLGGDFNIIPSRIVKSDDVEEGSLQVTDAYYIRPEFSWSYPDYSYNEGKLVTSYLGRIPAKNVSEAEAFIDKILNYEKPYSSIIDRTYYHNYMFCGAYMQDHLTDGYMYFFDKIRKKYLKTADNYWYLFDHFNCSQKDHEKQIYDTSQGAELNKENFISALQAGTDIGHIHFVFHKDHSITTAFGISSKEKAESLGNEDADNLSASPYYHIIVSNSCHPADFYRDCVAEHLLNNRGGTIAFIGNTDIGWRKEYWQFEEFLKNLLKEDNINPYQYNIGYLAQKACFNTNSVFDENSSRLHLLGDPTMSVWTDTPKQLNVFVAPTTVTSGENLITVKVNNLPYGQKALICLMKEEEGYATITVDGPETHTFTFTPRTSGTLHVTVTAHNYIPYENDLQVIAAEIPAVYISDLYFQENNTGNSIGNGDGQLDAGETVDVTVKLKNSGNNLAGAVRGILTCNSDHIEIMNREADFGSITPNGIAYSKTKFTFRIKENTPEIQKNDFNAIRFQLIIASADNIVFTDTFKIEVRSPEIALAGQKIKSTSNGDLIPQAGETIKFQVSLTNKGKGQAVGVWATLSSTSPFVRNCLPVKIDFLPIGRNETETGNLLLSVWLKDTYVTGTPIQLSLKVGNAYGKEQIFNFDLLNRPQFINSMNVGFIPQAEAISLYWPEAEHATGYNVYRSLEGRNGTYTRLNPLPLTSAYFTDEHLNPSSPYYYKVSGVSQAGNESDLSAPVQTWTSCLPAETFPKFISVSSGIIGSVNVSDVDNDRKKEIFVTDRVYNMNTDGFLMCVRPNGKEWFPTGGSRESFKGYTKLRATAEATPAMGDLYGRGEENIVTLTRNNDKVNNYLSCFAPRDENEDGSPDLLWETRIPSPFCRGAVLANVDNSCDGTLEIIVGACDTVAPIRIYDCEGKLRTSLGSGSNYACLAVADLDEDGDKEIIAGYDNGLYIWHHDGTPFGSGNPFFTAPDGENISSSPIVCDLNNDGKKEILIASNGTNPSYIYAIGLNGDPTVTGWNGTQSIPYNYKSIGFDHGLSVGDLNGDGKLEVAALGIRRVKVWDYRGKVLLDKAVPDVLTEGKGSESAVPILADVDGDGMPEIVFGAKTAIHALHLDGEEAMGFPLQTNNFLLGSVCVSDIDNDGKNELLAGDFAGYLYNWKTNGKPIGIQWGSERHDSYNTGEYGTLCAPLLITSDITWSNVQNPCGNIIIESGKLTVPAGKTITLGETSKIIVRKGAVLEVDGGTVQNAFVRALKGSNLIIKNGGRILLRNQGWLDIEAGAEMDNEQGTIE